MADTTPAPGSMGHLPIQDRQSTPALEDAASVQEDEKPPADVPTIVTDEEPSQNEKDLPPLPRSGSNAHTPTTTDFMSPPRSPFAPDSHAGDRPDLRTLAASRDRTDSQSTAATASTARASTRSSLVFVVTSLEGIAASKDAKRHKKLIEAVQNALSVIKSDTDPVKIDPEVLFLPLQLATEVPSVQVVNTALDCLGKLISYSYFALPAEPQPETPDQPPLIERAIDAICDCFQSEATPPETQLQIVKSLLSAILNDKIVVHGAGLLKAVRLTYNIFLLSKNTNNQTVAQGALTQMVGTVFERVKSRLDMKEARLNSSKTSLGKEDEEEEEDEEEGIDVDSSITAMDGSISGGAADDDADSSETASTAAGDMPVEKKEGPKITLQSFENRKSFDDGQITETAPTLVTRVKHQRTPSRNVSGAEAANGDPSHADASYEDEEDEIFVRDAYLVFRAMCRLSTKAIAVEHALDVKSQGMRSKLLSLHILYTLLNNNTSVFISPYATIRSSSGDEPTSFVQAIKQYLCLSLSRNGQSAVRPVFEVSCEIFWLMLKYLRVMLKKELEVFLKEIYLNTLEKRAAPTWQKQQILAIFSRLSSDPRALVEVYLNYDCDRTALDNMFERIVEHLSRISSTPVTITAVQQVAYQEHHAKTVNGSSRRRDRMLPPSLSTTSIQTPHETDQGYPQEYAMKQESLEILVDILRSLASWCQQNISDLVVNTRLGDRSAAGESRESLDRRDHGFGAGSPHPTGGETPTLTPATDDDPSQYDREKQRKTALANAIRQFNFKPKRGLKLLVEGGFIKSRDPYDVAAFFLANELNKAALGEFLGEGDEENIAVMHAFVDLMDFRQTRFVDALRRFLQSFRLPGEAQKIDRFMLKFAERYINGNPKAFANADTAYVLAYSVVMLNTDQHSANIKGRRMTPEDFIKNNRGINDNADLPEDYLRGIYDEIAHNEIVLDTERAAASNLGMLPQPSAGIVASVGQALVNAGRDGRKEEYEQTEQLADRTEQLYKTLLKAQRRGAAKMEITKFIPATSFKHVGPMFQVTWMPFLTALTGAAQNTQNIETVRMCMEGLKLAIKIACLFDLEDPRQAFVAYMSRFTNLYNLSEMKAKNMEALRALLDVANSEGDALKDSWGSILTCISQLDRLQLISTGVNEETIPDAFRIGARGQDKRPPPQRTRTGRGRAHSNAAHFQHDIAEESRSAEIIRSVDRIFTNTANLNGEAIIYFVKALTEVSWQEIQSSGQSDSPRTYSLQKIVEICNYNMTRVRFEWTNIWQVLGKHFNQVGCHTNTHVVFFAMDSLRQLSMRFLDLEELAGFKFQKDFLKPFEHIIANSTVVTVKDMVLRCLIQMIQAKGEHIRSGWRTMFGVFTVAAKEPYEGIVNLAFDNVTQVYNTRFGVVISQGAFADLIVCLTQFSKNHKFQKKSLQAIEMLKTSVAKMLRTPECPLSKRTREEKKEPLQVDPRNKQPTRQTQEEQYWFPVLFAFHDVLMTGDDLEVRSRALNYLFETLMKHGGEFPPDFWDTLWRQLLYPIFMVLRSKTEMMKMANHEELAVWLSTTMIQALRNMVMLFTHFFEALEYMLDRFLDLLILCICQENDTLARIGSNCLQQLILQNVTKFTPDHWSKIVGAFVELFNRTEATALFAAATSSSFNKQSANGSTTPKVTSPTTPVMSDLPLALTASEEPDTDPSSNTLSINNGVSAAETLPTHSDGAVTPTIPHPEDYANAGELEDYNTSEDPTQTTPAPVTQARRRFFNQIITKCVLSLLMIETVNELFSNDAVYAQIPSSQLLRLMGLLKKSYHFAKRFNGDRELRTRLFKEGFMKQPPNLLKQESGAAAVYVSILLRMYHDTSPTRVASREETEAALVPLCADIVRSYVELDEETQQRNIQTWRPVVGDVLEGFAGFPREEFDKNIPTFAPLIVGLLGREMGLDLQHVVQGLLARIFEVRMGLKMDLSDSQSGLQTPGSDGSRSFGSRRGSRNLGGR